MHVITLLLIEWEFISIINCTCYSVTYMGTYGSLYVTLCFVLCHFYFGVLTFYFRILNFLFMRSVYNIVHFKRRNSRGRDKI